MTLHSPGTSTRMFANILGLAILALFLDLTTGFLLGSWTLEEPAGALKLNTAMTMSMLTALLLARTSFGGARILFARLETPVLMAVLASLAFAGYALVWLFAAVTWSLVVIDHSKVGVLMLTNADRWDALIASVVTYYMGSVLLTVVIGIAERRLFPTSWFKDRDIDN